MRDIITRPIFLWTLFALFILESAGFGLIQSQWDLTLIDTLSDPGEVRDNIGSMDETKRSVHRLTTLTLDVLYPLTYGLLFSGLALRIFKPIFALPAVAAALSDLTEGAIQISLLSENYALLSLKAYVTPIKFLLVFSAILISILALVIGIWKKRKA